MFMKRQGAALCFDMCKNSSSKIDRVIYELINFFEFFSRRLLAIAMVNEGGLC